MNELKKKSPLTILTVAVLLVVVALLFALGKVRPRGVGPPEGGEPPSVYEAVLETASVTSLAGRVTAREPEVKVEVSQILGVDIPPTSPRRMRTVITSESTKFFERRQKSDAEFQSELDLYNRKQARGQDVEPPLPYVLKVFHESDLKVGDVIVIEAAGGVDIKDATTIQAAVITRTSSL